MSEQNNSHAGDKSADIKAAIGVLVLLAAALGFWCLGR